jgi:tol-pal system protein YbgF
MGRRVFDRTLTRWFLAGTLAVMGSGCAAQSETIQNQKEKIDELNSRVKELERTNGRLMTRIDEMEDDVFLLEDRVEAHRLALKRRGRMGSDRQRGTRIEAPRPSPQTSYRQNNYRGQNQQPQRSQGNRGRSRQPERDPRGRTVTTIPSTSNSSPQRGSQSPEQPSGSSGKTSARNNPSDNSASGNNGSSGSSDASGDKEKSIVITAEDFRKFAGKQSSGSQNSSDSADTGSSANKSPQKRVTEEKLKTTDQLDRSDGSTSAPSSNSAASSSTPASAGNLGKLDGKTGLDLYKASLSLYRSGNYAAALRGFQSFMDGSPRRDYQDNGLYWIGECYFGLGRHERSIDYFERVINEQPDGNKVPDAMLKMALAYKELGNRAKTRSLLEKLTNRYPTTNAGRLGKKKLSDLNS